MQLLRASAKHFHIIALMTPLVLLLFSAAGRAADDLGPPVGSLAPDIGRPADQTGQPRGLADLMGSKGLVLLFFRSAEWCPFCQAQLMDLNSGAGEITKRGYNIAALSYDSPQILAAFTARRKIDFTFLSDPSSTVIDRYHLRDPDYPPGSRAYGVPRPIIFILDRSGLIKAKIYEATYTTRPPVGAVIARIDQLP